MQSDRFVLSLAKGFLVGIGIAVIAVLLFLAIGSAVVDAEEAPSEDTPVERVAGNIIYGFRLQSDLLFYVVAGILTERSDLALGIGMNDSVWAGAHLYFHVNQGLAAFSGAEFQIVYPSGGTVTFIPSIPIGFALRALDTVFYVSAIVTPALSGEPITATLALSFFMEI